MHYSNINISSDKVKEIKMASNNNNNNIEGLKGTWDYVC